MRITLTLGHLDSIKNQSFQKTCNTAGPLGLIDMVGIFMDWIEWNIIEDVQLYSRLLTQNEFKSFTDINRTSLFIKYQNK